MNVTAAGLQPGKEGDPVLNQDKLHEECGVFGIYNSSQCDVVRETFLGLYALQHRGQESCGIAVSDDGVFRAHKDRGLVSQVFGQKTLESLGNGLSAIGHVRYSPSDELERANAQPLVIRYAKGSLAVAMNGALVNGYEIRTQLQKGGAIFQTTSNAETISYVIARERLETVSIEDAVQNAMDLLKGAYSMEQAEWELLPRATALFCAGRISVKDGIASIVQETSQK